MKNLSQASHLLKHIFWILTSVEYFRKEYFVNATILFVHYIEPTRDFPSIKFDDIREKNINSLWRVQDNELF